MSPWSTQKLGEIATLQRGNDLPKRQRAHGIYPVIGSNGPLDFHNTAIAKGPGVTVGRSGSVGKVHWIDVDFWPLNTSLWVKDFHGNDPKFVYWLLHSLNLGKYSEGAGVPTLNRNLLHPIAIRIPPLDEQKRIAAVLDKADALRRQRKEALELTEKFLQSVFLDMFGDPVSNPKNWDQAPLTKVCKPTSGGTPSKKDASFWEGNLPWYTPKDLKAPELYDSIDHVSESVPERTRLKVLPAETVLIVVRGMILAHSFPVSLIMKAGVVNQDIKALVPIIDLEPQFLAACLIAQKSFALSKVTEAGHGTKKLDSNGLAELQVILPPKGLQEKFVKITNLYRGFLNDQKESLLELENLFSSLQQRAFLGELDLTRVSLLEEQSDSPEPTEKEPVSGDSPPPDTSLSRTQAALDIPTEIKTFLEPLDEEVAKGELINWSPEFFKYRIIGDKMNRPFTFEELMLISNTIFYDSPPYEEAKAIVFEMLEAKQLKQTFDEQPNRRAIVLDLA
ncbi:restriction endonuclease subunit S [Pelagicoccus sp. SDUM812002]|uniref:restriction endonuclease subunit S n=1 Tax=Pelagicoccus sp. SDUM812002 TaxID=3041266 RepID=UPI00280CD2D2|nr:restriction endonuclease subunit S [Pelagicoccus sp. SDUM812002]MDQ8187676.1 restriction endonuclease subunit S [Pelagicoccus sp. SDUM812002]